jgi:hypothetical protein
MVGEEYVYFSIIVDDETETHRLALGHILSK